MRGIIRWWWAAIIRGKQLVWICKGEDDDHIFFERRKRYGWSDGADMETFYETQPTCRLVFLPTCRGACDVSRFQAKTGHQKCWPSSPSANQTEVCWLTICTPSGFFDGGFIQFVQGKLPKTIYPLTWYTPKKSYETWLKQKTLKQKTQPMTRYSKLQL